MSNHKVLKARIYGQINELLDNKITSVMSVIESAKASRDSDTKSSVGDKYETGRAMMQIEIEQREAQLNKAINLKNEFSEVNLQKPYSKVEFGSLVITSQENYLISIGIGKTVVDGENYYAISLASPIGMLLKDKTVGEKVDFQGRTFMIKDIV